MKKSHDTIATRLAQILTKLNSGERFTAIELSEEFNVNIRTIQRDLKERLSYLPIKKENGYYSLETYALGKLTYEDIKNFATISGIKELYPDLTNGFISDILNSKVNSAFIVKNSGFEKLGDKTKEFEDISAAILNNKQLTFVYNDKERIVNPYKLANINGIWYLVADEDDKLKNYTFSKIQKLKTLDTTFTPKENFLKTVETQDLNWFTKNEFEVVLEIDNSISDYFLRRSILPNQRIIEQTDTKLILSTKISFENEILNIVKHGIPNIKILSPSHLQEKLENILRKYLKTT